MHPAPLAEHLRQLAARIDEIDGFFIPFISVKSAWETMVGALGWPTNGEGGMKLIRRTIAQLLRDTGTPKPGSQISRTVKKVSTEQIEVQLGHRVIASVSDLYAIFDAGLSARGHTRARGHHRRA